MLKTKNMGIGTNLKKLRSKTKLSQQDIAAKLNIDRMTYANWESEVFDVKSQYIPKLAEIFQVELSEFFKNDSKNSITNNIENNDKTGTGGVGIQKGKIIINLIITDEKSLSKIKEELDKYIKLE